MALAGDFFRTTMLIEVKGVATQTAMDWKLDSIDGADPINTVLLDLAGHFWNTLVAVMPTNVIFSCFAFDNWSRPEKAIVYPLLAGTNIGSAHPQFSVVRGNIYAQTDAVFSDPVYRGSSSISGVAESLSTRGRINDFAEFVAWESFLWSTEVTSVTGWTITPHLRREATPGPPPTYEFKKMRAARVNPKFLTLRSRKTRSCV